jgi:hypothetical protein
VQKALYRRYEKWVEHQHGDWDVAMVKLIGSQCRNKSWFRWFDSGDLQDGWMLDRILRVCSLLPDINFWMSTRERNLVRNVELPANLVIRASADMIDQSPPVGFANTSSVHRAPKEQWEVLVEGSNKINWFCPSLLQGNQCGTCRACWDRGVKNVAYKQH